MRLDDPAPGNEAQVDFFYVGRWTDAEARLGGRFDIRTFHDAVLGHGPLPLGTLREAVSRDLGLTA